MSAVHVRDIPVETVSALKRLARHHHRSLQGELRNLLERAARQAPAAGVVQSLTLKTVRAHHSGTWRRVEIYDD